MIKHKQKYQKDFDQLLYSKVMEVYQEPERKLDAEDEKDLTRVEQHIRRSSYYVPVNCDHSHYGIPEGIHVTPKDINGMRVKPAGQDTARRFRLYYDTPDLDGYHGGVEVRIQFPDETEHGHAKPFKQVVKLGRNATINDPTFHRIEISSRLAQPVPSFEPAALDGNKKLSVFLKEYFDVAALRPLQLLTTVRTRYYCRPGGEDTVVEFGYDRGRAMTINDYRSPILQIEPEVLHGDVAILDGIGKRLTDRFNGQLAVNLDSKPTPGFKYLDEVLRGNKKAKDFILTLPRDEFRIIAREECPALF